MGISAGGRANLAGGFQRSFDSDEEIGAAVSFVLDGQCVLSNASGGSLDARTTATVTIIDDDAPPAISGGNGSGTSISGSSGGGGGSLDQAVLLMLGLALCAVARRRCRDL